MSKRRKRPLQATRKWFHLLCGSLPDVVLVTDEEGHIVFVNSQIQHMFGYSPDELLGQPVEILLPDSHRQRHRSHRSQYFASPQRRPMGLGLPLYGRKKDGLEFPVDISLSPMETLNEIMAIAVVRDISDRKQMEELLRKNDEKYRMIIESVDEFVYLLKIDGDPLRGTVELVNHAVKRLLGYEPHAFFQDPDLWFRALHPDDVPSVVAATRKIITTKRPGTRKYRIKHNETGEYRLIEDHVFPRFDSSGNLVAFSGVARDVTERARSQEELFQAHKMEAIGRMAGGVAHDFNNLLMVIGGHAALLRHKRGFGKSFARSIKEIDEAIDSASSLTRQLLALSSRQITEPRVLDLNAKIRNMVPLMRRVIGENIALTTLLERQSCYVRIDPGQMEQIILNLAANGRDAMPNGGKLSIQTSANVVLDRYLERKEPGLRKGFYVALSITDTGRGMDEETRARIFEPFLATKKRRGHTGLGLATVYGIVRQSKGHVSVSSEKGQGTTFTICLPRSSKLSKAVSASKSKGIVPHGSETVLLLEDSRAVRKLLRSFLERQGYRVLEAAEPRAALELAKRHRGPIHLFLTDIVLPEMSGSKVAAQLAKVRPGTKVMFISGYASKAVSGKQPLIRPGAFLQKPFSMETLGRKIREVLDS